MGRFHEQTRRIWRKRWRLDEPGGTITFKAPKPGAISANPLRPTAPPEVVEVNFAGVNAGWDPGEVTHDGYRTSNSRRGKAVIRKDGGFSMPTRDFAGREALTYENLLWLVGLPNVKAFVNLVPVDITLVQDDPRAHCLVVQYEKASQVPGK